MSRNLTRRMKEETRCGLTVYKYSIDDTFAVDNEESGASCLLSPALSMDLLRNTGNKRDEDHGNVELEGWPIVIPQLDLCSPPSDKRTENHTA